MCSVFMQASQMALVINNQPAIAGDTRGGSSVSGAGKIPWSRKWQPTPVFSPGKFHGQRSLACCSPWGCKESDMSERLCIMYTCPFYWTYICLLAKNAASSQSLWVSAHFLLTPGATDAVLCRDFTTPVILSPLALRSDMRGPGSKFEHVFLL